MPDASMSTKAESGRWPSTPGSVPSHRAGESLDLKFSAWGVEATQTPKSVGGVLQMSGDQSGCEV